MFVSGSGENAGEGTVDVYADFWGLCVDYYGYYNENYVGVVRINGIEIYEEEL